MKSLRGSSMLIYLATLDCKCLYDDEYGYQYCADIALECKWRPLMTNSCC